MNQLVLFESIVRVDAAAVRAAARAFGTRRIRSEVIGIDELVVARGKSVRQPDLSGLAA